MGTIQPKPDWVDSTDGGELKCDFCEYHSNDNKHLAEHTETYHPGERSMILYMGCDGSIEGRNALNGRVSAKWIDCTGGQAVFEDSDLKQFGDELVEASRDLDVKLCHVFRMFDPGLGLDFPMWWVEGGIDAGVFEEYILPDDVIVSDVNAGGAEVIVLNEDHLNDDNDTDKKCEI